MEYQSIEEHGVPLEYFEKVKYALEKKGFEIVSLRNEKEWTGEERDISLVVKVRCPDNDLGGKNTSEDSDKYHINSLILER